jgi:hypothetical protein
MKRLEWLKDRVTQMGHPPHLYERWHAEIERLEKVKPAANSDHQSKHKCKFKRGYQPSGYRSKVLRRIVGPDDLARLSESDHAALTREVEDALLQIAGESNLLPSLANWLPFTPQP